MLHDILGQGIERFYSQKEFISHINTCMPRHIVKWHIYPHSFITFRSCPLFVLLYIHRIDELDLIFGNAAIIFNTKNTSDDCDL